MAKITFGPTVAEARGKCGGVVFSRFSSGAIQRAVPKLVNPKSLEQQIVRANVRATGKAWGSTLTDPQRAAWTALASSLTYRDRFAQQFSPSGQELFSECTLNALLAGGTQINNPPLALAAPDPGLITATACANPQSLLVTPTLPPPAGYGIICMVTKPINPGRNWWATYLRVLRSPALTPLPPSALPNLTVPYLAKFGAITAGKRIGVTLAYVNLTTGAKSTPQSALATITGPGDAMLQISTTLTAAQIQSLYSNPITLLPAPPAGYLYLVYSASLHYKFGTVPFNFPTSTLYLTLGYPADITFLGANAPSFFNQTSDRYYILTFYGLVGPSTTSPEHLGVFIYNNIGNATAGDGTCTITIDYTIQYQG
jgi:hypothetical protein